MEKPPSLKKRKSFRRWLRKVTTPKVAPLLPTGSGGKGQGLYKSVWKSKSFILLLSLLIGVFGVPLVISISYARGTIGYQDADKVNHQRAAAIPLVVSKCGSYLKRNGKVSLKVIQRHKKKNALNQMICRAGNRRHLSTFGQYETCHYLTTDL